MPSQTSTVPERGGARRALMIAAEFPPAATAASHRFRLLAPHLPEFGWEPTIVTVDPRDHEARIDPDIGALLPANLRVIYARAWKAAKTRRFGLGDVGLRAYSGMLKVCRDLLRREQFDVVYITVPAYYPAHLGPRLKREFGLKFVLDYIDPWVGAWGLTAGPKPGGKPDWKSRLSRQVAVWSEPRVVRHADAFTAVSASTYEQVFARNPEVSDRPAVAIPYGGELADFEYLRAHPRANAYFDPEDGNCHLCYVGTLLPLGFETLRAVLGAARKIKERDPAAYARLRFHFFGTSNQTSPEKSPQRVLPVAREMGVEEAVREVAARVDYLDALTVQTQATAILMMGSSERHYTASKLYPGLLAKRPILAIYHEASSVTEILHRAGRVPTLRAITYNDEDRAESRLEPISSALLQLLADPVYAAADVNLEAMSEFSARSLTGTLASLLDQVCAMAKTRGQRVG